MRNLQNPDIFAFGRIIKQANIKEEIKKLALDKNTDVESVGFDLLFTLFINCSDEQVEQLIYEFLASIFELDVEEVKRLDPLDTVEMLSNVADWKKWKGFFSSAAKSIR